MPVTTTATVPASRINYAITIIPTAAAIAWAFLGKIRQNLLMITAVAVTFLSLVDDGIMKYSMINQGF